MEKININETKNTSPHKGVVIMAIVSFILIFILIILLAIVLSTITIKIEELNISNCNYESKLKYNFKIFFELQVLSKIKILSIELNKEKLEKLNLKNKLKNINFNKMKNEMPSKQEAKKIVEKLNIEIPKLDLNIDLGTENVIVTSALITIISALLGIGFAKIIKKYEKENHKYIVTPIYQNRNLIKVQLNCIIKVKMVHIISIIYILSKKRRVEKHERTSNRRTYDYSYE